MACATTEFGSKSSETLKLRITIAKWIVFPLEFSSCYGVADFSQVLFCIYGFVICKYADPRYSKGLYVAMQNRSL